jgi:predicted RNA-binding protein with PIN domain
MKLLIDGYNLLHLSAVSSPGHTGSGWAGWRNALINFLAEALSPSLLAQTTIVFDAADAPKHLPSRYDVNGMTVLFSKKYQTADEHIAVLIGKHTFPKKLTVVSSDHAVQRSARRRKAIAIDSEVWLANLARRRGNDSPQPSSHSPTTKPKAPLDEAEVDRWLSKFSVDEIDLESWKPKPKPKPENKKTRTTAKRSPSNSSDDSEKPLRNAKSSSDADEIQAFAEAAFLDLDIENLSPMDDEPAKPVSAKGGSKNRAKPPPTTSKIKAGKGRPKRNPKTSAPKYTKAELEDAAQPFSADVWEDLARIFEEEQGS